MPVSLHFGDKSSKVLPEIVTILEEMIRFYNDWEGETTYLKLESRRVDRGESSTSSRYELYSSKADLLEAIIYNCPVGCSITN